MTEKDYRHDLLYWAALDVFYCSNKISPFVMVDLCNLKTASNFEKALTELQLGLAVRGDLLYRAALDVAYCSDKISSFVRVDLCNLKTAKNFTEALKKLRLGLAVQSGPPMDYADYIKKRSRFNNETALVENEETKSEHITEIL